MNFSLGIRSMVKHIHLKSNQDQSKSRFFKIYIYVFTIQPAYLVSKTVSIKLFNTTVLYLQWVFGADGQDLVLEVAQLTAPGASFTDPADKAGLVGAAHRAITATGAQQLPLQDTKGSCMSFYSAHREPAWCCDCVPFTRSDLVTMKVKMEIKNIFIGLLLVQVWNPQLRQRWSHFIYKTVWGYRVCSYFYREAAGTVAERAHYTATY